MFNDNVFNLFFWQLSWCNIRNIVTTKTWYCDFMIVFSLESSWRILIFVKCLKIQQWLEAWDRKCFCCLHLTTHGAQDANSSLQYQGKLVAYEHNLEETELPYRSSGKVQHSPEFKGLLNVAIAHKHIITSGLKSSLSIFTHHVDRKSAQNVTFQSSLHHPHYCHTITALV